MIGGPRDDRLRADQVGAAEGDLAERVGGAAVRGGVGIADRDERAGDAVLGVLVDDDHVERPGEVAAGQAAGVGIAGGEVGVGAIGAVLIGGGADRDVGVAGDAGRGAGGQPLPVLDGDAGGGDAVEGHDRAGDEVGAEAGDRDERAAGDRAAGRIERDRVEGEGLVAGRAAAAAADLDGRGARIAGRGRDLEPPRVDEPLALDPAAADPHLVALAEAAAADGGDGAAAERAVIGIGVLDEEGRGGGVDRRVGGRGAVARRRGVDRVLAGRRAAGGDHRQHEHEGDAPHRRSMAQGPPAAERGRVSCPPMWRLAVTAVALVGCFRPDEHRCAPTTPAAARAGAASRPPATARSRRPSAAARRGATARARAGSAARA